jgi:hypothetical protein
MDVEMTAEEGEEFEEWMARCMVCHAPNATRLIPRRVKSCFDEEMQGPVCESCYQHAMTVGR